MTIKFEADDGQEIFFHQEGTMRKLLSQLKVALTSKKARKVEAALIAYAIAELTKRGYLPTV
jgi:hypothetical protein